MAAQRAEFELKKECIAKAHKLLQDLKGIIHGCENRQPPPPSVERDLGFLVQVAEIIPDSFKSHVDSLRARFAKLGCHPAPAVPFAAARGGASASSSAQAAPPPGPPAAGSGGASPSSSPPPAAAAAAPGSGANPPPAVAAMGSDGVAAPAAGPPAAGGASPPAGAVAEGSAPLPAGSDAEAQAAGTAAPRQWSSWWSRGWRAENGRPGAECEPAPEHPVGGDPTANAVAGFLRRGAEEQGPQRDEVLLLALDGHLQDELSQSAFVAMPQLAQVVMVRPWDEEDDAVVEADRRVRLLRLHDTIATLQEVHVMLGEMVQDQQEGFDDVIRNMETTADNTQQVIAALKSPADSSDAKGKWVAPAVVCALTVGGVVLAGSAPCCMVCWGVRGMLVVSATAGTGVGSAKLSDWQRRARATMTAHLPRALEAFPQEQKRQLKDRALQAEGRLLEALTASWTPSNLPTIGWRDLALQYRASSVTTGSAWRTEFRSELPASLAFQVVRGLALAGSLDPGSEVCWSCPVDDEGTYIRYLVFTAGGLMNREFYCICRCGKVDAAAAPAGVAVAEQEESYVFAVMSMDAETAQIAGFPEGCTNTPQTGHMFVAGVAIHGFHEGGCEVKVMADVDANIEEGWSWAAAAKKEGIEHKVRLHVLNIADAVRKEMGKASEAAPAVAAGVEPGETDQPA